MILILNSEIVLKLDFHLYFRHGSMEQPIKPNLVQYRNQPGRIENYTPGKSSVSDKESKQVQRSMN